MTKTTSPVRLCVVLVATLLYLSPLYTMGAAKQRWNAGYRFELMTADGSPANDMMGSGAFLQYQVTDSTRVEWSFEYKEYEFESPQRYAGFSRSSLDDIDSRTRSTLISLRAERAWDSIHHISPLAFAGLGMGYTVIEDIRGISNGEAFDINAEGGMETVPFCGVGIRCQRLGWSVDGGLKVERHLSDWVLEDRVSGRSGEVGDYTAWGAWLGLSIQI